MSKKVTDSEFLECVNAGLTINEIRDRFGYTRRDNVIKKARKLNVYDQLKSLEPNKVNKINKYDHELIAEKIKAGLTRSEIVSEIGCSLSTITEVCNEFKLKIKRKSSILDIEDFTNEEFQVLYGTLLGDGYLSNLSTNIQGSINHCLKQEEFIKFKQEKMKRFTMPVRIVHKHDNRNQFISEYDQWYCYIRSSKALNELYPKIYQNKIKYINKDLLYKLDGLGLAIWYMDDGSKQSSGYQLCTMGFSESDLLLIQEFFKEKFDIDTTIFKNKSIYIVSKSKEKFENLIKPYIIPSMLYKLH